MVLREVVRDSDLIWERVVECKQAILEGIYQAHLVTRDNEDTLDSLERAVRRFSKSASP